MVKDFRRRLLLADRKQELLIYLRRIHHAWSKITSSNSRLMNLVDAGTVRYLESRAPATSSQDAAFVRTCMDSGKIFAQVLDPGWRKTITTNICAVERIIPSLWTFLEHTKHLAPCARAIKVLLELHQQTTIYGALSAMYAKSSHDQKSLVFFAPCQRSRRVGACRRPLVRPNARVDTMVSICAAGIQTRLPFPQDHTNGLCQRPGPGNVRVYLLGRWCRERWNFT